MRIIVYFFLVAALGMCAAAPAEADEVTYYVQLIRGNNEKTPPSPEAKLIGPKLSKMLKPVFNWESFWEINRAEVKLALGHKIKLRLSKSREVEIDLTHPDKRTVIVFVDGREVSRNTRPVGDAMNITGGERGEKSVWFTVVRRDKPGE